MRCSLSCRSSLERPRPPPLPPAWPIFSSVLSFSSFFGTCSQVMKCCTPRSSQEAGLRTGRAGRGRGSASPPAAAAAVAGASTSPPGQRRGTSMVAAAFPRTAGEGWAAGEGPTCTRCVLSVGVVWWAAWSTNQLLDLESPVQLAFACAPSLSAGGPLLIFRQQLTHHFLERRIALLRTGVSVFQRFFVFAALLEGSHPLGVEVQKREDDGMPRRQKQSA